LRDEPLGFLREAFHAVEHGAAAEYRFKFSIVRLDERVDHDPSLGPRHFGCLRYRSAADIQDGPAVEVTCEFCQRKYTLEPAAARALFGGTTRH